MSEFLFFKESSLEEKVWGRDWENICVVGQDGKGWTNKMVLSSVSPWIGELVSSLPPHVDYCIILPDMTWKDITGFFQSLALWNSLMLSEQSWDAYAGLGDLLKITNGSEDLNEKLSCMQNLMKNVNVFQESKHFNTESIKTEDFMSQSSMDLINNEILEAGEAALVTTEPSENKITVYNENKVKCVECKVILPSKKILRRHIKNKECNKTVGKPGRPIGPINKRKYSERQLRRIKNSSNIDSYNLDHIEGIIVSPCNECGKKCISPDHLKQHKEKNHPTFYECEHCQFIAYGKRTLKIHIHSDHVDLLIFCDICNKQYSNPNGVLRHKKVVHEGIRFPCDQCEYKAKSRKYLRVHLNAIHEKITIPCDICGKTYTQLRNLEQHQASVHKGIFYLCDQCDYKGTQRRNLQRHIEKEHKGIFYQCDQCDYRYTQQSTLNNHIKKHHKSLEN